jgi:hypothetical protein
MTRKQEQKLIKDFRKDYPDYSVKDCIIFIEFLKRYNMGILVQFTLYFQQHEQSLSR